MSTQMKPVSDSSQWQDGTFKHDYLPFAPDARDDRHLVSDPVKLRTATALQSTLHVRDIVTGFTREVGRIVRGVGVKYRHKAQNVVVEEGTQ